MISVCIATYNGARFVREQIESILPQLEKSDEIVVSDDGSKDETLSILHSFNDARIKILSGPCKGHPRYNFENGLKHCNGDFIFLCDQDDIWEPNKVEVFMRYLKDHNLVVSNCYVVDADNNIIRDSYFNLDNYKYNGYLKNLISNHYLGCCMAFDRNLLSIVLPFPTYIALHDIWIGLCAEIFKMKILFIPDKLMRYRRYDGNFSFNGVVGSSKLSISYRICYRVYFVYKTFTRFLTYHIYKRKY